MSMPLKIGHSQILIHLNSLFEVLPRQAAQVPKLHTTV